jgi:hypothetical protein
MSLPLFAAAFQEKICGGEHCEESNSTDCVYTRRKESVENGGGGQDEA